MDEIKREVKLQRYFPSVVAPAKEFRSIADAENPEFSLLYDAAWKWYQNTFAVDIDEDGADRWEAMLSLHHLPEDTLQDRRMRILLAINAVIPDTIRRLQQILDAAYGDEKAVASTNTQYELWVDIDNSIIFSTVPMRIMLRAIVPANLTINVMQQELADGALYAGGKVSMYQTINVAVGSDFSIGDMNVPHEAGGVVSTVETINIESEAV